MNASNLDIFSLDGKTKTFNSKTTAVAYPVDDVLLDQLLDQFGVAKDFIDYSGNVVPIPRVHRLKIIEMLGVDPGDADSITTALAELTAQQYGQWLPPVAVIAEGDGQRININVPRHELTSPLTWSITTETGENFQHEFIGEQLPEVKNVVVNEVDISVRQLALPALGMGYHRLTINDQHQLDSMPLIVTPARCYEPQWLLENRKLAGLSLQLYSLRSERNWGVGDFSDLNTLLESAAANRVDFIVLNPLHLLDADHPEHCSPYSPMDRRRLNPLYIDPLLEPDFTDNATLMKQFEDSKFQRRLEKLRAPQFVDYTAVTKLKYAVFGKMFSHFKKHHLKEQTARAQLFLSYIEVQKKQIMEFANFQAKGKLLSFTHASNPLFHCYLQWLAEKQLENSQQLAIQRGMPVGLVRDMAVGGDVYSAEVELNKDLFCLNASIGAPPDPLAPQGQNWGLPPIKPVALRQSGYRHFIELLRTNMAHCGALRIDHVMALMRLWWCPNQGDSDNNRNGEGAYVFYPVQDLFALLRLESQRRRCVVIGEDLGVVPPEVRNHMATSSVLSNVLFYFEKYDPIHFKRPEHFPGRALAMIANHDVPTLAAWWNKSDLAIRHQIGLINEEEELAAAIHARESDLIQILHWLNETNLLPESWRDFNIHREFDVSLCRAILQANGYSSSQLVSAQVDDLCLTETPINIPGTCNEYPNWRRKLPQSIASIFSESDSTSLLNAFVQSRKS